MTPGRGAAISPNGAAPERPAATAPARQPASQAAANRAAKVQRIVLFGLLALTVFAAMGAGVIAITAAFGSRVKVADPRLQSRIKDLAGWRAEQVVGASTSLCPNCGRLIAAAEDGDGSDAQCTVCAGIEFEDHKGTNAPGELAEVAEFPELAEIAEADAADALGEGEAPFQMEGDPGGDAPGELEPDAA